MSSKKEKDRFRVKIVESASPLTKQPATPFRLAALGILEDKYCYKPSDSPNVEGESLASQKPTYPVDSTLQCTTEIVYPADGTYVTKNNQYIEIILNHGESESLFTGVKSPSETFPLKMSGTRVYITGREVGKHQVPLIIEYNGCAVCELTLSLEIQATSTEPGDGDGGTGGGGCMPTDPAPTAPVFTEGSVNTVKSRTCSTIFESGKVDEYKGKDTYKWKIDATSEIDVDHNIKLKFGESATLEGAAFWKGLEYIYNSWWFVDNKGTISPDVPKMQYGFNAEMKVIEDVAMGFTNTPIAESWTAFHDTAYKNYGISDCASTVDKASLWASSQLKIPFLIDNDASWLCVSPVLETVVEKFKEIHLSKIITLARARDVAEDSPGTITGAFVSDVLPLKEHLGFLNIEPQLEGYTYETVEAFFPADYKTNGGSWTNYEIDIPDEYMQFAYADTGLTDNQKKALVTGAIAYHELAHALDNRYYDFKGTGISKLPEWLKLSGWVEKSDGTYQEMGKPEFGKPDGNTIPPVTAYGCSSPAEDFAEAYAMFKYNPKFLCYYHPAKYDFIKKIEAELFGLTGITVTDSGHTCEPCEDTYAPEEGGEE